MQQQTRTIYRKLPPHLREIIASPEFGLIISGIAKNNNLDDEKSNYLSKIVTHILVGIETKENLLLNIIKFTGIDENRARSISDNIKNKIFNNLDSLYKEINYNSEKEWSGEVSKSIETETAQQPQEQRRETPPQSNVGNSFETIILNQAKAMQPAIEEKPRVIHNYIAKTDPYREPAE